MTTGIRYSVNCSKRMVNNDTLIHLSIIIVMIVSMLTVLSMFVIVDDHGFNLASPGDMTAYAADLYVGPSRTYTTIQAAVDAAVPYDVIHVDPGTYGRASINKQHLTLQGTTDTYIDGLDAGNGLFIGVGGDYASISTFKFINCYAGIDVDSAFYCNIVNCYMTNSARGIWAERADYLSIDLCGISNSDDYGLRIIDSDNVNIDSLSVGTSGLNGGYITGSSVTLSYCTFSSNSRHGLTIGDGVSGCLVSHIVANNNGLFGGTGWSGLSIYNTDGADVQYCDLSNNPVGLNVDQSDSCSIHDNTIASCDNGIRLDIANLNNLFGNILSGSDYNIYSDSSANNNIYGNRLTSPVIQNAYDTTLNANSWSSPNPVDYYFNGNSFGTQYIGNLWSDYTGFDGADLNGIGTITYYSTNLYDPLPLLDPDSTSPTTSITLSPDTPTGNNGWYLDNVFISFTVDENPGGSGLDYTEFYDSSSPGWQTYTGTPYEVDGEGVNTISFMSYDYQGNPEIPGKIQEIKIEKVGPTANFEGLPSTSGEAPLTVGFGDNSANSESGIVSWHWDFGDTTTFDGQYPLAHVYNSPGTYTVSLTVTDAAGRSDTETKTNYITVNGPSSPVTNIRTGTGYTTIQAAINDPLTLEGDVIRVNVGTYTESVDVTKQLTLQGIVSGGVRPKIDSPVGGSAITVNAAGVIVDNIDLDSAGSGMVALDINSNGCQVSNSDIKVDVGVRGILVTDADNTGLSDITTTGGIYLLRCTHNTLDHCQASTAFSYSGVRLEDCDYSQLLNCDFTNSNHWGVHMISSSHTEIRDCNIADNSFGGIALESGSCDYNTIVGNTIMDNGDYNLEIQSGTGNVFYLNLISNSVYGNIICSASGNNFNSPSKMAYTYGGNSYYNYLGNAWDDYGGVDSNGDGIGETAYTLPGSVASDNYPLMGAVTLIVGQVINERTGLTYSSISAAVADSMDGDTIFVNPGTYSESVNVNKLLTIRGISGGENPIVRCPDLQDPAITLTASGITIDHIDVANGAQHGFIVLGDGCTISNSKMQSKVHGIYVLDAMNTRLENCDIIDNPQDGIDAMNADGLNVINCDVTGNDMFGMWIQYSDNVVVDASRIENNGDTGIHLGQYGADSLNAVLSGNTINGNAGDGIYLFWCPGCEVSDNTINNNLDTGIALATCDNTQILRNVVNGNGLNGIYLTDSKNNLIDHSQLSTNNGYGIVLEAASTYNTITWNTVTDSGSSNIRVSGSGYNNIYGNSFTGTSNYESDASINWWNSLVEISYTYMSITRTGFYGNYWSDYVGYDNDDNGVGDSPYFTANFQDNFPIVLTSVHTTTSLVNMKYTDIAQPETMKVQVWVVRTGFPETTCHVTYSMGGGTATPGVDYSPTSGTLTFNPNEMAKPVWVTVNAANIKTPTKTFTVTLTGTPDATLGSHTATQVTIKNTHPSRV